MESQKEKDEFERIEVAHQLERARYLLGLYDHHQAFWRNEIETKIYTLGRLDERIGGSE